MACFSLLFLFGVQLGNLQRASIAVCILRWDPRGSILLFFLDHAPSFLISIHCKVCPAVCFGALAPFSLPGSVEFFPFIELTI